MLNFSNYTSLHLLVLVFSYLLLNFGELGIHWCFWDFRIFCGNLDLGFEKLYS